MPGRAGRFVIVSCSVPVPRSSGAFSSGNYLWLCSTAPEQQDPSDPQHLALEVAQEVNEKVLIAAAPIRIRIFFIAPPKRIFGAYYQQFSHENESWGRP